MAAAGVDGDGGDRAGELDLLAVLTGADGYRTLIAYGALQILRLEFGVGGGEPAQGPLQDVLFGRHVLLTSLFQHLTAGNYSPGVRPCCRQGRRRRPACSAATGRRAPSPPRRGGPPPGGTRTARRSPPATPGPPPRPPGRRRSRAAATAVPRPPTSGTAGSPARRPAW